VQKWVNASDLPICRFADSLISVFEEVDMFLRHITDDENVSCEL